MRILTAELRKTLTLRFLLILAAATLANLLLFHRQAEADYSGFGIGTFVKAQQEVMALPQAQRLSALQERKEMLSACTLWQRYDRQPEGSFEITEDMLKYKAVYESGEYLVYTDNLSTEARLNQTLLAQVEQVVNHHAFLNAAIEEARLKTSVSIYAKPGTFDYENQLATIKALEGAQHIQPRYDMSDGVLHTQDSPVTELIGLVLILFLCTEMVVTEQKNGILPILRATRKGRFPLVGAKIAAAFALSLLVTCALWGTNALYCGVTFGFGDLSRPVQSLYGFATSTMEISVGGFLALRFLTKWLLYAAVGLLCLFFGLLLGSAMSTWIAVGGLLCVEYILAQIPAVSAWNLLKYCNLSNLIFATDWVSEYRNANLFGKPVQVLTVSTVLLASLLIVGVAGNCIFFCRRRILTLPLPKLRLHWPKWLPRPGCSVRLFGHESWKLLIECGALAVVVLLAALNVQDPGYVSFGSEELYYKGYMLSMEGPVGAETDAFLEAEQARFQEIRAEINRLNQLYREGELTSGELSILTSSLERQLEAESVFKSTVLPKVERAKAMAAEGKAVWMVYDTGYETLFGLFPYRDKAGASALLITALLLCFSNVYPIETSSGMLPLLNTYRRGRRATANTKLWLGSAVTVLLFAVCQIPDYWYVLRNYGFPGLFAPICSLEAFAAWDDGISILGGIAIFEALRLMTALSLTALILLVGIWTKNQLITMSVSAGVLLMPVLLHLLGITLLDKVSFFLPVTGTALLQQPDKMVLYYGFMLILGVAATAAMSRYVRQGYQHRKRIQAEK